MCIRDRSIFNHFDVIGPQTTEFGEKRKITQGHSRSPILVPIDTLVRGEPVNAGLRNLASKTRNIALSYGVDILIDGYLILLQIACLTDGRTDRQLSVPRACSNRVRCALKATKQIFMKILLKMYLGTRKNWLNFGSHPLPDPDPGIFRRILQHCEIGHFQQFGSHLRKNWSDLHENCVTYVSPDKEVPLTFGNRPDPESASRLRSGPDMPRRGYALSEEQLTDGAQKRDDYLQQRKCLCFL